MRERGSVLLVQGPWPQTEAMIDISDPEWSGLGEGYGVLERREVTVSVSSRRFPVPRSARLVLPDFSGEPGTAQRGERMPGAHLAPVAVAV